ncbi:helix-turn-helix transcriptional regulator [Bosea sp. 2RAB26]|uniref:helix-turn-helix transcriptional regulator n=1 Tax=Bosea sp. 2RAB26 TaxID=3237476 RepID=UPI003F913882
MTPFNVNCLLLIPVTDAKARLRGRQGDMGHKQRPPDGRRSRARPEADANGAWSAVVPNLAKPAVRGAPRAVDLGGLQKVVARIQDVVAEPESWSGVLKDVSAAAGAQGASLFRATLTTPDVALVSVSAGSQQIMERYIRDGWVRRDIRTRAIPKMLKTGIGVDQDFMTPDAIEREPYYQDLLAPCGLRWWAGVAFRSGDDFWCIAIQRNAEQGYFDPDEQAKLATLCQGLTEAATITRAVGRARIAGMTAALDLVGQPALVLDHFGRVLRENAAAANLYDPWFHVVGGRIVTRDREAAAAFSTLVEACRSSRPLASNGGHIVVRRSNRRPIVASPLVLSGSAVEPFSGGRILLLLNDLDAQSQPLTSALGAAFGLTAAEARLAAMVGSGGSIDAACEALHVTRQTARNQLKSIFDKTDTHRQAELVALLARLMNAPRPRSG